MATSAGTISTRKSFQEIAGKQQHRIRFAKFMRHSNGDNTNMAQIASNIDFRTSQSFVLGSGQSVAGVAGTLNYQAARDLILGRPLFSAAVTPINQLNGQVNVASVQGASILASNQNLALRGLTSTLQQNESFIGIPLVQNGVAQFQFTALNAADQITGGIYCDPWGPNLGEVPAPDAMGPSSLN